MQAKKSTSNHEKQSDGNLSIELQLDQLLNALNAPTRLTPEELRKAVASPIPTRAKVTIL